MKLVKAFIIAIFAFTFAAAQNEQSPMVEKDVNYKDWTYKSITTDADVNLRALTKGSKLTIVVYYAPWCPNWRHDAPMLQRLYEKYHSKGLLIVGVGEYDPVASMKTNLEALKVTFPTVYESLDRSEKQNTLHYGYRQSTGDARNWGSPYYVLLPTSGLEKKGDLLMRRTHVINGEMIEAEGEKFIREKLGLPPV